MKLADYYQLPFIQQFDSWQGLAEAPAAIGPKALDDLSQSMRIFNARRRGNRSCVWTCA